MQQTPRYDVIFVGEIFYFNYPGGPGLTSDAVFGTIVGAAAAMHARADS
jgi:hypothetical protein